LDGTPGGIEVGAGEDGHLAGPLGSYWHWGLELADSRTTVIDQRRPFQHAIAKAWRRKGQRSDFCRYIPGRTQEPARQSTVIGTSAICLSKSGSRAPALWRLLKSSVQADANGRSDAGQDSTYWLGATLTRRRTSHLPLTSKGPFSNRASLVNSAVFAAGARPGSCEPPRREAEVYDVQEGRLV
jgi:hypothetical protein